MSYPIQVREAALARLAAAPAFKSIDLDFQKVRRSPMRQIQPADLPCLAVYFLGERGQQDGDGNAGEPRFLHEAQLGISVVIAESDDDKQEDLLDRAFDAAMDRLLTDASFVRMVEAFTGFERTTAHGLAGGTNETPFAELRLRISFSFRTDWPPVVTDDFKTLGVKTAFPAGGSADQQAHTQQVRSEYEISQE